MIKFTKMHGTGNNYIYLDLLNNDYGNLNFSNLAKKISDKNYGIGSDGLILVAKSKIANCKMIMYNKDGSEGDMCGNGIRCAARYYYEKINKTKNIKIETNSGIKKITITNDKNPFMVNVDMGKPILKTNKIPVLINKNKIINEKYNFGEKTLNINSISMGNPHTVIFVDNVDDYDVLNVGNLVQNSNIFPNKCNVEFVSILSKNHIKMRVLERGSGETMSCGTGACASVVIGILNGYLNKKEKIQVDVLGGTLYVTYDKTVYLEGDANFICEGIYFD